MLISKTELNITPQQLKMIEKGWGEEMINTTEVCNIKYDSDGLEVKGYLAHPKDTSKKYPLIIWNRGGNLKNGYIDEFLARGMYGELASWGYVVLASSYRMNEEFGGKDVNDILNLFPIADELEFCDSTKIGMEGWSRGGMMTFKVLTITDRIKCAVIISGLADLIRTEGLKNNLKAAFERQFGCDDAEEFEQRKKDRSPVNFADKINKDVSVLLIHGTADDHVSPQDSIDMYKLLQKNNIHSELKLIENGDHYLTKQKKETAALRKSWFDKYLK
ncbi:MAG: S9 family peptidase [Bacteroidetes bacterium]|nr:S9 family peptidase [Bacteroidota bacterium]